MGNKEEAMRLIGVIANFTYECGCGPPVCRCRNEEALACVIEDMQDTAKDALQKLETPDEKIKFKYSIVRVMGEGYYLIRMNESCSPPCINDRMLVFEDDLVDEFKGLSIQYMELNEWEDLLFGRGKWRRTK